MKSSTNKFRTRMNLQTLESREVPAGLGGATNAFQYEQQLWGYIAKYGSPADSKIAAQRAVPITNGPQFSKRITFDDFAPGKEHLFNKHLNQQRAYTQNSGANLTGKTLFSPFFAATASVGNWNASYSTSSGFGLSRTVPTLSNNGYSFSVGAARGGPSFSSSYMTPTTSPYVTMGFGGTMGPKSSSLQGRVNVGFPQTMNNLVKSLGGAKLPSITFQGGVNVNKGYSNMWRW